MGAVSNEKRALRRRMKELRESLGREERARVDAAIANNVAELAAYRDADVVFTYLSVGTEVDTRAIIADAWASGKVVAVPRCVPDTRLMTWHCIHDFDGLERGSFGIEEPPDCADTLIDPCRLPAETRAIALVPAYSFDARGFRLGYGGGFYDEFLPTFPGVAVGLCRSAQMSESPLPLREGDVPVGCVVTECGVIQSQAIGS